MIEHFHKHKADFERLVDMLIADDGLIEVDILREPWEDSEATPITSERLNQYRELLARLGAENCNKLRRRSKKPTIYVQISERGWPAPLTRKGYLYSTRFQQRGRFRNRLVDTLDDKRRASGDAYRWIEGDWYLFFARA